MVVSTLHHGFLKEVKQQLNPAENIVGIIAQVVDTLPIIMEAVGARQAMRRGGMYTPMGMLSLRGTSALKRVREKSTADFSPGASDTPLTVTDRYGFFTIRYTATQLKSRDLQQKLAC